MKILQSLFLLALLSGCSIQKYCVTTEPEMIKSYQEVKESNGGYWGANGTFMPGSSVRYKQQNKVILIPPKCEADKVVSTTLALLKQKKYDRLEKYLKALDPSEAYLPLSRGLLFMHRQNFRSGLMELRKSKVEEIHYIVELLMVDCEYELSLVNSNQFSYQKFLEKYQRIIDRYELDANYKEIVNDRIQFVRYKI